jgi:hypothetical protein
MASLNKVILLGNLTREPELRYTPGGAAVCEFGLAMNRRFVPTDKTRKKLVLLISLFGASRLNPVDVSSKKVLRHWSKDVCSSINGKTGTPVQNVHVCVSLQNVFSL